MEAFSSRKCLWDLSMGIQSFHFCRQWWRSFRLGSPFSFLKKRILCSNRQKIPYIASWGPNIHFYNLVSLHLRCYSNSSQESDPVFIENLSLSPQTKNASNDKIPVILHFDNRMIQEGCKISRLGMDGKIFIEDLFTKFQENGRQIHQKHFSHLEEILLLEEPMMIHCLGKGTITWQWGW